MAELTELQHRILELAAVLAREGHTLDDVAANLVSAGVALAVAGGDKDLMAAVLRDALGGLPKAH